MSNARRDLFLKVMVVWLSLAACGEDVREPTVKTIPSDAQILYINQLKRGENSSQDPFPEPIPATEGSIEVNIVEFASLPDFNGEPAIMMLLVDEPGTGACL